MGTIYKYDGTSPPIETTGTEHFTNMIEVSGASDLEINGRYYVYKTTEIYNDKGERLNRKQRRAKAAKSRKRK